MVDVTWGRRSLAPCPPELLPYLVAALRLLEVDEIGLTQPDRTLLTIMIEKFGGGPVGLSTLGAATSEEQATIEEVYEPFLLKLGLLERTPRGRRATKKAYEHLDFEYTGENQEKLL